MTEVLNGGTEFHVDLASKWIKSAKTAQKSLQNALVSLATLEASVINDSAQPTPYVFKYQSVLPTILQL